MAEIQAKELIEEAEQTLKGVAEARGDLGAAMVAAAILKVGAAIVQRLDDMQVG